MIVLDVDILVAASRADHSHHTRVRPWLEDAFERSTPFGVPDVVWVGFVRICTNPRVFPVASSLAESTAFAAAVIGQPGYVHLGGLRDSVQPFLDLARRADAKANLCTDAYIAALAQSWGATVASLDRDFRRFDQLSITEPGVG